MKEKGGEKYRAKEGEEKGGNPSPSWRCFGLTCLQIIMRDRLSGKYRDGERKEKKIFRGKKRKRKKGEKKEIGGFRSPAAAILHRIWLYFTLFPVDP